MAKQCEVCAACESKYKCPGCRLPYCSAACYKTHKATPCGPAAAATGALGGGDAASSTTAPAAGEEEPTTTGSEQQAPPVAVEETETETEGEGDGSRLTADQLGLLKTSEFVRKHLASPAIVQALAKIDAAPDRMKELEKAMLDQAFASFICQALDKAAAGSARA